VKTEETLLTRIPQCGTDFNRRECKERKAGPSIFTETKETKNFHHEWTRIDFCLWQGRAAVPPRGQIPLAVEG
jgi:hypothetical protein